MIRTMRWKLGILAALGALATGCADDHWVEFRYLTAAPAAVQIESDRITIPAGMAVGLEVIPFRNGDEVNEEVELISERFTILGVDPSLEDNEVVIYGVSPGSTSVDMYFDGEYVGEIPALVIEQDR